MGQEDRAVAETKQAHPQVGAVCTRPARDLCSLGYRLLHLVQTKMEVYPAGHHLDYMYSSPTRERWDAVLEQVENMSLQGWLRAEGVQRYRSAGLGGHCGLVVTAEPAVDDLAGQHGDHICLQAGVSSTVKAAPIYYFEGPRSGRQTVLSKTRKGVNCAHIVVGKPVSEVAVLHDCILAAEVVAGRRMSEAVA